MKIAIVRGDQQSEWISCNSILNGLIRSYSLALEDCDVSFFSLPHFSNHYDVSKTVELIKLFDPDKIIYLDYRPSPGIFLQGLCKVYLGEIFPAVYIHIYGDFVLNIADWLPVLGTLKKIPLC